VVLTGVSQTSRNTTISVNTSILHRIPHNVLSPHSFDYSPGSSAVRVPIGRHLYTSSFHVPNSNRSPGCLRISPVAHYQHTSSSYKRIAKAIAIPSWQIKRRPHTSSGIKSKYKPRAEVWWGWAGDRVQGESCGGWETQQRCVEDRFNISR
jgi:hypothetical protein